MSISIMKTICIILSLSLVIGATVDQGEEWKDGPLTEVQDSPKEDDTFSDTYQPLDEAGKYNKIIHLNKIPYNQTNRRRLIPLQME